MYMAFLLALGIFFAGGENYIEPAGETHFDEQALYQFVEMLSAESGAFDADFFVGIETAEDSFYFNFEVKTIFDTYETETLLSAIHEPSGWLAGLTVPVAVHTIIRGGDVVESRMILGDSELTPETIRTFGLAQYKEIAATDFRGLLPEINAVISSAEISAVLLLNRNNEPCHFYAEAYLPYTRVFLDVRFNAIGDAVKITLP